MALHGIIPIFEILAIFGVEVVTGYMDDVRVRPLLNTTSKTCHGPHCDKSFQGLENILSLNDRRPLDPSAKHDEERPRRQDVGRPLGVVWWGLAMLLYDGYS